MPLFASVPWGCSWQEVPWSKAGIESSKLEYLAYRFGFFYEGHRAEIDCRAPLELLRRPFEQDGAPVTALKVLLDSARAQEVVQAELAWLKEAVFGGENVALELEEFDAKTRYSGREGKKEKARV